jgi:hypothetical protein
MYCKSRHRLRIRIRTSVRFFDAPFGCDPGANAALTKSRIGSPSFGGLKNLFTVPSSGTPASLTLERHMEPDAADSTPSGRRPDRPKKEVECAPFDAHSEIGSIVLNAPLADVYACCSRFEELPRFITSLREVQRIDETHFSFTSLLDGKACRTVLQIVLRIPERRIAWQAMPDDFPRGVILFEPLSNRTTEVTVRVRSSIEPATLAKVTRNYLTNFKRVVEQQ